MLPDITRGVRKTKTMGEDPATAQMDAPPGKSIAKGRNRLRPALGRQQ
jgi:hypothetical protein